MVQPANEPARPPAREITDEELAEEAARVRRHERREKLSMGLGVLIGLGGVAGWFATGFALVFVGSLALGMVVYSAIRPRGSALDPQAPASLDAETRALVPSPAANLLRWFGRGLIVELGWLVGAVLGAGVGTLIVLRIITPDSTEPLRLLVYGLAGGGLVGAIGGSLLGKMLGRKLFGKS